MTIVSPLTEAPPFIDPDQIFMPSFCWYHTVNLLLIFASGFTLTAKQISQLQEWWAALAISCTCFQSEVLKFLKRHTSCFQAL